MATLLLVVIYISFIGLGIPDSLFGAAWPAIYGEFSLPISFGSFVTVTISCCTVVSSVLSSRVIGRFGTNKVSAVSTALTALGLFGFSCAGSFPWLILCAIPLGLGAGAIDTALNNYVALHYSATHMSFLHCFYGVGVSLSPYILSLVISGPAGWRGGYRVALCIQLCITALMFLTLPVWAKAHGKESGGGEDVVSEALPIREVLRIPGVKGMCLLFITSVGIETTCGTWGSTFLVEYKHMAADQAAGMVTFYYIGMALGRFLSGVLASRLPLFPNFNYLTPESFGPQRSQSVMGVQMAFSYVGSMGIPTLFGVLGQLTTVGLLPLYLLVFFVVMVLATWKVKRILRVRS